VKRGCAEAISVNPDSISEVRGGGSVADTERHERDNTTAPHFANCVLGWSAGAVERAGRNEVRRLLIESGLGMNSE
jgi:hypothetical protein